MRPGRTRATGPGTTACDGGFDENRPALLGVEAVGPAGLRVVVGTGEQRAIQISGVQFGAPQVCTAQICAAEVCTGEIGVPEVGLRQV